MLKGLFRLIGTIVVIIVLVRALLFYLDGKGLLFGRLGDLIHTLRLLGNEAWTALKTFGDETGIVDDASGLLGKGVDMLQSAVEPHPATISPDPLATISPVVTATPAP